MTGPLPPGRIGYRNGDNTALRWALFQAWKQCCYSCREPQVFGNSEIDHIIPRTTDSRELQDLIAAHGLDADFHLDQPANLALICRPCNGRKSDRNLLHALVTTTLLALAKDRAPQVEHRYVAYRRANDVAKGLIEASKADAYDPQIRQDFLEYAPAIVRTLALIDEDKASDFTTLRHLQVNGQPVIVGVDPRGRFALRVITDICGDTLEAAIEPVLRELTDQLDCQADEYLRSRWRAGSLTVARANALHMHVTSFHRDGATIAVNFLGGLTRDFDVSITDPQHPSVSHALFEPPEGELRAGVCFEMTARWDLTMATGTPRAVSVTVDSAEYEIDEVSLW